MTDPISLNPHIVVLPPYNAGMSIGAARRASGHQSIARLASNENPDGCSPAVLEALAPTGLEPWRYSDPACMVLREALSEHLATHPDHIVVGNGSEEMIAALSRALLLPGDHVATVAPSFGLHEIEPRAMGATVVKIPMTSDLAFDLPAILDALSRRPKLLMLSSPWNPVGPALSHDALDAILKCISRETVLVFDEAYFEYADEAARVDGVALLAATDIRYVVLRTFSKAYGLAGLRVGYAVCSDIQVADAIRKAKTPFNVNVAAQTAALAALGDQAWMKASVARTRAERGRVALALQDMGYAPAVSQTNFLFFACHSDSTDIADRLLKEGVIVKPWREDGYQNFLRITIGHPDENDRLLLALRSLTISKV
ncbi:histidinol-phosphate transaminase [Microvirga sp. TS319]|uniref:histidinol-phosphate transaminase n=1 Tax=Microvirga sp. TS319 TaxID=3241165 RepID=UPI003519DADF